MEKQDIYNELTAKINSKRNLMIRAGMTKGLNHFETIQYSEELDKLIHTYQMLIKLPSN
ncbi:Spo0E family sporulation regulatory protein-aspartic acid phosphatase [Bacillus aerolatus]|uniref:Spo0E family sporulation regulatory protein-aspartic acid phosphatase n=1 Tax=Bacillus aerolatus TaxID=2653354 RepID=A0A6I1FNX1_9BACI|nr:aspartyl-phosphate phosphatase Spo0E family protein [Bacillus aerolatus]KAB7709007.1 Spo0E family sporulation regulatory protein-aspartic acid phosphatase [Bacillus aerolatus]